MRLARLLKLSHYTTALEDLVSAIYSERQAFVAALYLMVVALFLSSSLIYVVEHDAQPEAFPSIPETMWWSIVTLTTVGYGDVSPITAGGKLIGAFTAIMGVCTVALLTGIVGAGFSKQMSKQYAEFEHKLREALDDGIISSEEAEEIEELRANGSVKNSGRGTCPPSHRNKKATGRCNAGQAQTRQTRESLASVPKTEHNRHQLVVRLSFKVLLLHFCPPTGANTPP